MIDENSVSSGGFECKIELNTKETDTLLGSWFRVCVHVCVSMQGTADERAEFGRKWFGAERPRDQLPSKVIRTNRARRKWEESRTRVGRGSARAAQCGLSACVDSPDHGSG